MAPARVPAQPLLARARDMFRTARTLLLVPHLRTALLAAVALLLAACANTPPGGPSAPANRVSDEQAARAAEIALAMLGKPYRYRGSTPEGFDCSGLVSYSYTRVGLTLPRDTRGLRDQGVLVPVRSLRAGDLLFFDQEGRKLSHVGIWLGEGRFVHAPSTGGRVRVDRLDADYWSRHFVEARRI
jgi:cell wall-associated NlpC family hydrolase